MRGKMKPSKPMQCTSYSVTIVPLDFIHAGVKLGLLYIWTLRRQSIFLLLTS